MKNIAIIPARGGSKRIPKKNVIDFFGKPMIAWTIEAALQSELFDKVIVSTDDLEIAEISKSFGAEVPFLRFEAEDDFSPVSDATLSCLIQAEKFWQSSFDTVVQLMPNCPIRNCQDIVYALKEFNSRESDFQISAFEFGWMNPWWAAEIDDNHEPKQVFPKAIKKRSQDLKKLYCPTGAIWIARSECLKQEKTFYGKRYVFSVMPWSSAVDIDDYSDLEMAKATYVMKYRHT
ncbi:MAG: CMP-N-acetylneuraminic acid synthetase [Oleiphilaceae bacterium]